jgi:hypothetical protein
VRALFVLALLASCTVVQDLGFPETGKVFDCVMTVTLGSDSQSWDSSVCFAHATAVTEYMDVLWADRCDAAVLATGAPRRAPRTIA